MQLYHLVDSTIRKNRKVFTMLFIALIIFICAIVLTDYLIKKKRNNILQNVPGPKGIPVFGNVFMYKGLKAEDVMDFMLKNCNEYGPLFRVWVFQRLAVFTCDPKDFEVIMSSTQLITKNNLYNLLHNWLGDGLLLSTGKKWHARRKIITPAFHFKILEQFIEILNQQSNILVKKLYKHSNTEMAVDISKLVGLAALDIIAETAMGVKINAQDNPQFSYVKAVHEVSNITTNRFINIWQRDHWIFRVVAPNIYKNYMNNIKIMHDFTENIITQRRKALEMSQEAAINILPNKYNEYGQKHRIALLDVLLQSTINDEPLSNKDIREEVDTFMFEGHDTTTSGISYTLYIISRHPDVQEKIFKEIQEVLGKDKYSLKNLNELKYLECVIKESLRLYPPVPLIGRYFDQDVNIRGKHIPCGTNVTLGIFAALRDSHYFENPNEFQPERFFDRSNHTIDPFAYTPFSAGPRNCIGQKFAILELKIVISEIIRHFELLPFGPEVKPMVSLILRSATGVHVGLKSRIH